MGLKEILLFVAVYAFFHLKTCEIAFQNYLETRPGAEKARYEGGLRRRLRYSRAALAYVVSGAGPDRSASVSAKLSLVGARLMVFGILPLMAAYTAYLHV